MIQVCEDRGLEVSPGLAGAALRHAYRTPSHGFDCGGGGGEALDGDEVARLVEVAADALANDRGPAMETIRMQASLDKLIHQSWTVVLMSVPFFAVLSLSQLNRKYLTDLQSGTQSRRRRSGKKDKKAKPKEKFHT